MRLKTCLVVMAALAIAKPASLLAAPAPCPVIDAFADFVTLADQTVDATRADQLARFHDAFLARHGALYTLEAVGLTPG